MVKILAFAGSTRADSLNKKLVQVAAQYANTAGAEVTVLDLKDYPMPLYDGDAEAATGLPDHAKKFKAVLESHQGLLLASPEYNGSLSAVLKNAIDWATRGEENAFAGKTAALLSASPGAMGGLRGLMQVRQILAGLNTMVLPEHFALGQAHTLFDDKNQLKDDKVAAKVKALAERLVIVCQKLAA
jgi:NAD(P)H-dependent FMN reductase